MTARIYQPARNAMQQGMAARDWVLEYESDQPLAIEPLDEFCHLALRPARMEAGEEHRDWNLWP